MRTKSHGPAVPLALLLISVSALRSMSENVTLTTSYPSPAGIYRSLTTTGATTLARDGGRVGIGTAAPKAALDVRGQLNFQDPNNAAVINFPNTGTVPNFYIRSDNDPTTYEAASERLFIGGANGNVGIGTAAPAARLAVEGEVKIGNSGLPCSAAQAGAVRYQSGSIEFCNGSAWSPMGGGSSITTARSGYTNCNGGLVNLSPFIPAGKRIQSLVVLAVHDFDNDPHPEGYIGVAATIAADGRSFTMPAICSAPNPFYAYTEGVQALEWHVTY